MWKYATRTGKQPWATEQLPSEVVWTFHGSASSCTYYLYKSVRTKFSPEDWNTPSGHHRVKASTLMVSFFFFYFCSLSFTLKLARLNPDQTRTGQRLSCVAGKSLHWKVRACAPLTGCRGRKRAPRTPFPLRLTGQQGARQRGVLPCRDPGRACGPAACPVLAVRGPVSGPV